MSVITREDLEKAIVAVGEVVEGERESLIPVVLAALQAVAPEKLLASYEIKSILEHCRDNTLDSFYSFYSKQAAIELQLPDIWFLYKKMESAEEEMKQMAKFFLKSDEEVSDV